MDFARSACVSLFALLVPGAGVGAAQPADRPAPVLNEKAPPLIVTALNGQTIDLSTLRGKVVLVNYWATWCAPCRKEIPAFDAFYRRHHDQGLEIVGISIDFERDLKKVARTASGVAYPIAVAAGIVEDGFGHPDGVPVTYVVDAQGVFRDRFIAAPAKLLQEVVVPMLPHAGDRP